MRHPNVLRGILQVLNIAGNQLSGSIRVQGVPKLRALIANDNAITAVKGAQGWVMPLCSAVQARTLRFRLAARRTHTHVKRVDALSSLRHFVCSAFRAQPPGFK